MEVVFCRLCPWAKHFWCMTARPLHDLTKKDTPFTWAVPQQNAFNALKQVFTSEPILAIFDPARPTRLEVDASGYATGGVLSQKCDDDLWHPIAYRSQSMTEAERNYEIYDREMLAIHNALLDWRHFLEGFRDLVRPRKSSVLDNRAASHSSSSALEPTPRRV